MWGKQMPQWIFTVNLIIINKKFPQMICTDKVGCWDRISFSSCAIGSFFLSRNGSWESSPFLFLLRYSLYHQIGRQLLSFLVKFLPFIFEENLPQLCDFLRLQPGRKLTKFSWNFSRNYFSMLYLQYGLGLRRPKLGTIVTSCTTVNHKSRQIEQKHNHR